MGTGGEWLCVQHIGPCWGNLYYVFETVNL